MRYTSLALLLFCCGVAGRAQQSTVNGTWTAELDRAGDRMHLQLRATSNDADGQRRDFNTGQSLATAEFTGLPDGGTRSSAAAVTFELRREAGTLDFDGAFRDGRGAGLFTFVPRSEFTAEMRGLGYTGDIPAWQRFQLTVHDVGPRYIRALETEGYDNLTLGDILRGRSHGLTLDYIREMKAEGYRSADWSALVRARDHGAIPAYVQALRRAGFAGLPLEEVVRAKDHGATVAFIQELTGGGDRGLTLADVIRAKDHGVSGAYLAEMRAIGFKDLTLADVIRLRDHGVTPGFINHVRARGYRESTVDDVIRLKNRGVLR
jgi:hypothetical protein